jgi:adenosine deaminase
MPSLFKTNITAEYLVAVEHCGFSVGELEELALNAVHASLLSEDARLEMLKEFTTEYLRLREEHQVTPDTIAQ